MSRLGKVLLPILLLLVACSFSSEEILDSSRPAEHPDMELIKSRYLFSQGEILPLVIVADKIEIYKDYDKAYITNGSFQQYDSDGSLLFSGYFEMAEIETATNDLEMEGKVKVTNHRDNFTIEGENLHWNNSEKIVSGDEETLVTLIKDEHDILEGLGFTGDLETSTFEFLKMERGHLHYD
ncbi:MAG: LPS export ABC transporter periplasmic protein LptC [Sphaerochaetaceae bacterium]